MESVTIINLVSIKNRQSKKESVVEMKLFNLFKRKTVKEQIIEIFYSDYPETPYIADDRQANWIDQATLLPEQRLVEKAMMQRDSNGLLPGHVYMLYWLGKYTNKKVPGYFEYKYGIDFEKEKEFLRVNGYLNDSDKPTDKGERIISDRPEIIKKHSKPRKRTLNIEEITQQIMKSRDRIIKNGFKEYKYIASRDCCDKCKALDGKHFLISEMQIGVNARPMHDGCLCAISEYEDPEEYEAWLDFISNGGSTAEWERMKKAKK